MPTVKLPDGTTAQFPDEMAPADIQREIEAHIAQQPKPQQGFFGSAADSSGLSSLGHAIAHPIDTVMGLPDAVKGVIGNTVDNVKQGVADYGKTGLSETTRRDFGRAVPVIGPTLAKAQEQHDAGNDLGMAGTMTGLVGSAIAPSIIKGLPMGFAAVGDAAQGTGVDMMNGIVGAGKNAFKRGANPAQGYFDAGGGPALSMKGLATKGNLVKSSVGSQIGDMRDAATKSGVVIPTNDVASALNPAISKGIDLETGAGGGGNTNSIENYSSTFRPTLKTGIANGGLTPNDLFDLKDRISKNTNWGEPGQYNLKAIRQANAGALSGLENDTIPDIAPLKTQYQSLKNFTNLANSKAETGSLPLTTLIKDKVLSGLGTLAGAGLGYAGHENPLLSGVAGGLAGLAANSVAAKSLAASGLYYGGGALDTGGEALGKALTVLPKGSIAPYNLIANKTKKDQ